MSRDPRSSSAAGDQIHDRARSLAAEAVDGPLRPVDASWLRDHLAGCADCSGVADEYQALHQELRSLQAPEPPRDLWARTSAALDAVEGRRGARRQTNSAFRLSANRPLIGTSIAVGLVVLVAAASLLAQGPIATIVPGSAPTGAVALATRSTVTASQAPQAPLAVVNGTSYWIASDQGVYQIKGSSADCAAVNGGCTVGGDTGQTLGSIQSGTAVSAVLAPDASQAAVWTADKIAIVPLATTPQTVSMDLLTPRPTVAATATPTATGTAIASATATPTATATPAPATSTSSPAAGATAAASPLATIAIVPSVIASPAVTPAPTASPADGTSVTKPTAILDGYEIVGRDPEFSPDGSLVAFSARPVDHSTGPDLFVWRSGQEQAHSVTTGHSDLFAGWFGQKILVGEIAAGTQTGGADTVSTRSFVFDPASGDWQTIDRPMLVAGVDPTGKFLVYWSGSVEFDTVTGLWQPGKGDLYVERWAELKLMPVSIAPVASASPLSPVQPSAPPSASPFASASAPITTASQAAQPDANGSPSPIPSVAASASPEPEQPITAQVLKVASGSASVRRWTVRWDAAGQNVAVWVADPGSVKVGGLTVFSIDRTTGLPNPTLAADEVMPNIGFYDSNLVYTSAMDGKTYMKPIPVVPPPVVPTPAPPTPAGVAASARTSPLPAATNRPGA
jgi:hypothetical protein